MTKLFTTLKSSSCIIALMMTFQTSHAQSSASAPQETDEIIVTGDRVGLLEQRPTDTVFGFDRSGYETPRSISIISDTTIERYSIEDIDDFITTTPGTFGGTFFGVPGSITIRGGISESYFRGFKRTLNNGLFPTPIGSADRVEIVRGATPVVYGAGRIGGFLNFHPSAAGNSRSDEPQGSLAVTVGSFDKLNVTGDVYIPFDNGKTQGGLALYAEYEDSDSFYRGREPQHELFQADYYQELGNGVSVELGGMYFNSEGYLQTIGWNRLTQELIDDGIYTTGIDTDLQDINGDGQLNQSEIDAVVGTFFGSSNIRTFVDFGVFEFPDAYALDTDVGTTTLNPRDVFLSDRDIADSETLTLYADITKEFKNSTAKLQFFYDEADGQLNQTYGFAADQQMDVFEARGSYTTGFDLSEDVKVDLHATASHRIYDSRLREQFLSGYLVLDRRDLSQGATATDILATPLTDSSIPWDSDFDSLWTDTGAALVADIQVDKFSLLLGGRYDDYDVDATDAGVTTFGAPTEAEASDNDFSYSASLSYNSDFGLNPYITYAEGSEPLYNSNGGISPGPASTEEFLFDSELLEVGLKFELLNKQLSGSLAYYDQERTLIDSFQNVNQESSTGFEAEVRYLINENFTLTGAATFQDFEVAAPGECGSGNGAFFVIPPTHPSVDAFGQTITGPEGFGGLFAALNSSCLPELQDGFDRNIIPDTVLSGFATYTSDETSNGFTYGGTLGATYVSETGGKTVTAVTLPSYVNVRGALFGTIGQYNLTATVDNLFDTDYFQPVQDVFEEVAALPGQGRTFRVTAKVNF